MKYQLTINFRISLKKCAIWLATLFLIYSLYLWSIKRREFLFGFINPTEIENLLGFFTKTPSLIFLYQFTLVCFYTYIFFEYEKENNPEYTLLRLTPKKWILLKMGISITMIFIFKLLLDILVITYLNVSANLTSVILNILEFCTIPIIYSSYISLKRDNIWLKLINILFHIALLAICFITNSFLWVTIISILCVFISLFCCNLKYTLQ